MFRKQITKGLKQLVAIVAFRQNTASAANPQRDRPNRADASCSARSWEPHLPPYVPDSHRERSDSSLHLGC